MYCKLVKAIHRKSEVPEKGFSLIELILVITVIGIIIGFAAPSISQLGGPKLGTAAREVSSTMNVARSEAISKNTAVRFGIVVECGKFPEFAYNRYGLWTWDKQEREFKASTDLTALPDGFVFDPKFEDYVKEADYAKNDPTSVRGTYFLEDLNAEFETQIGGQSARVKYLEFRPNGSARIPDQYVRRFLLILRAGLVTEEGKVEFDEEETKNWAMFATEQFTGNTKIHRP